MICMGKRLVIAEKPTVARDISQALSIPRGSNNCFESESWVISSALGHLFELVLPKDLAARTGKMGFGGPAPPAGSV